MPHPFELNPPDLASRLEEMVDATFADLQSQSLVMPKSAGYLDYPLFQAAYEVLKRDTNGFATFTDDTVWAALRNDALVLLVVRTILGFSPPEWADLARSERQSDIDQGHARMLDTKVRQRRDLFTDASPASLTVRRAKALVSVAVECIKRGASDAAADTVHRMAKVDTMLGLSSVQHAANFHVPYSVLLYERYLGRPFASYRDSVSGMVGDVMESAVEAELAQCRITFRKTRRAERIAGFEQAPDFFIPTEFAPHIIIEAKIISDDGTARDKVARILRLTEMRDAHLRAGRPSFEVVACVDGRGFGVRRQDMRDMLVATRGKVFTLATLDRLIEHTSLRDFLPQQSPPSASS
jgi:hypothetical protein